MADNVVSEFAKNDDFLKFDENDELQAVFLSVGKEPDPFKEGEERLAFQFQCSDGRVRAFSSKSKRLAKAWIKANPGVGDLVEIQRFGEKFETNFKIKVLQTKAQLSGEAVAETSKQEEEPKPSTNEAKVSVDDIPF